MLHGTQYISLECYIYDARNGIPGRHDYRVSGQEALSRPSSARVSSHGSSNSVVTAGANAAPGLVREAPAGTLFAPTQAQLATAVRRDKTRLIATLDRLEARGLLHRTPDPDDRRNRIVTLTEAGRTLLADCRRDIRAMETDLLSTLRAPDQTAFIRALSRLAESTREDTGVRQ